MTEDFNDPLRTRRSLLEGIRDPDNRRCWEEFVDTYAKLIIKSARRAGLRGEEVDEVTQTVLIEISKKIGEFSYDPAKGSFRGWLRTVASRRAIDQLRKRKPGEERKVHRPVGDNRQTGTIERQEDLDQTELERIIDEEWMYALHENTMKVVRNRVSPEQFQIYDAFTLQKWKIEKVQKVYGVTENTIYNASSRVGKIVKEVGIKVAADMDDPELPPEHPSIDSD